MHFKMRGVDIGPRLYVTRQGGFELLEVLGYDWRRSKPEGSGSRLDPTDVIKRCDKWLRDERGVRRTLKRHGSAEVHVNTVMVDMAELRILAQKACHAERDLWWIA